MIENRSLGDARRELAEITETLVSGGYDCTDEGEPWTDFGIVCGYAERFGKALALIAENAECSIGLGAESKHGRFCAYHVAREALNV